jgi:hypothetical protein
MLIGCADEQHLVANLAPVAGMNCRRARAIRLGCRGA